MQSAWVADNSHTGRMARILHSRGPLAACDAVHIFDPVGSGFRG